MLGVLGENDLLRLASPFFFFFLLFLKFYLRFEKVSWDRIESKSAEKRP